MSVPGGAIEQTLHRVQFLWHAAHVYAVACPQLSCNLVQNMRSAAGQNGVQLHDAVTRRFCARCGAIRLPGVNMRMQVDGTRRTAALKMECMVCGQSAYSERAHKPSRRKGAASKSGATATAARKQQASTKKARAKKTPARPQGKAGKATKAQPSSKKGIISVIAAPEPAPAASKKVKDAPRAVPAKKTTSADQLPAATAKKRGLAAILQKTKAKASKPSLTKLKLEDFLSSM
ncbi:hypothetical protein RI367_001718 [Sorochytrium milnesiophthora]